MNYRFIVRSKDNPDHLIGYYSFDGISAIDSELAVARLWDEIDIDLNPFGCEFVRLEKTGESRRWSMGEAGWEFFNKPTSYYYAKLKSAA